MATEFLQSASQAIAQHGAFRAALAGGETPRAAYERIAATWREAPDGPLRWDRVHLYWSDERMVPRDDPRSNFGMARAALVSRVPIPAANVHPIPIDPADPDAAAAEYERTLRVEFALEPTALPRFDLVLLGMGADGHTASLFPGAPSLEERMRLAVAARHPSTGDPRVTLTLPLLNNAAATIVLASGSAKAAMLDRAIRGTGRPPGDPLLPVERLRPSSGILLWMADKDAAPWAGRSRGGPGLR
ncbi:MAG TPA: 6-phosphogluconolactonase [Thermoanaerobaculia bacterium]|nr:6-phosphogluconolactonase [Thermoanaerobaculia bacterium]